MAKQSTFENIRISQEDRKNLVRTRNEKKMDFYLSLAKLTYTALVLGIIVGIVQGENEINIIHITSIAIGLFLTFIWYKIADNYLKR